MKIKTWYILAGGSATRWQGYQGVKNKCYVKIDGETLLERTERLLRANGITDIEIVLEGFKSKREAFQGIAEECQYAFGILLGDCYYTEAIIKDAVNRDVEEWTHYYNCLPNTWTGCTWEEGYIHLVPNWEWWLEKMTEFNQKVDSGEINFVKDFQIDRYLRGYSPDEYRGATLDEHDIFWSDETDDFDFPSDYDKFMERHEQNKLGFREDKVSVIIPHYNTPEHLQRLLSELKNQKINYYPETEIIVIDDGSDSDMSWLNSYPIKKIFEPNRGAAAARNVGLRAATGRYIVFMDADDQIESNYLHTVYQLMRQGYDYALFPFIALASGNTVAARDELIGNWAVWSWAFSWNCINGEQFDENLNVGEDLDWLKRVITKDKNGFRASEPIYRYDWNANPNSLCKLYNSGKLPMHKKAA